MLSSKTKAKKKPEEILGIIDIGSAQISGVILTEAGQIKKEVEESIPWQEKPGWDRFQLGIDKTLREVLATLASTRPTPKPKDIFVFLSAPFFFGKTTLIKANNDQPTEITPPYLADLIKKYSLDSRQDKNSNLVRLENEIMQIKLDGYPSNQPLGQMAKSIEIAHWQSQGHILLLNRLEQIIRTNFPSSEVHFQSFAYAVYEVFSELLPDKDWILVDTGNELTDILIIKNGYLAEHLSFPYGKNEVLRDLAQRLNTVASEAGSRLNRFCSDSLSRPAKQKMLEELTPIRETWSKQLSEALSRSLETTILPETIYLFGDEPSDEIFAKFIVESDFSNLTISRRPFRVHYIDKPLHQAFTHLGNKISPPVKNSFLLVESLFCATIKNSKLNIWPFNQLATTMKDIIKKKKSLRDIFPESRVEPNKEDNITSEEKNFKTTMYEPQNNYNQASGLGLKAKIFIGVIVLAIILALGFAISAQLAKITVEVTPRQGRLLVSNVYEATKNSGDILKFVLASNIQVEEKVALAASGSEAVKEKASGQITIYNNHSTASQALVANTRFETKDGLIYRISKGVTIPGQTKESDGQIIPGKIDVTVTADQPGDKYNSAVENDFTIPGFKGSAKYTTFYAKSKGAITGGFVGNRPKVSEADLSKARSELETRLTKSLAKRIGEQVPEGYVLFNDGVIADFTPQITTDETKPDQAMLTVKANGTGILFDKKELASYLAKQQVAGYQGESVDILNWADFKFSLLNKDKLSISSLDKISFKLDGTGELVWTFDEKDLKERLQKAGASSYKLVFENDFKMITSANIIFTPPWIRSIPDNPEKINIKTELNRS